MAKKTKAPAEAAAEQPYYLQRAHIKDFRSIRDAKVDFKPGLNIIIGPNGAGKTNLLHVLQNSVPGTSTHHLGSKTSFVFNGGHLIELQNEKETGYVRHPDLSFVATKNLIKWKLTLRIDGVTYEGMNLDTSWVEVNRERFKHSLPTLSSPYPPLTINHGVPGNYQLTAAAVDFTIGENPFESFTGEGQFGNVIFNGFISSVYFLNTLKNDESVQSFSLETIRMAVETVCEFNLNRIRPTLKKYGQINDVRLSKSWRVYANSVQQEFIVQGLVFEYSVRGEWLPFSALSSGTQRLFYVLSEVLAPIAFFLTGAGSEDYMLNESSRIILLEEPELGIHPDQLHLLLSFLREQSKKHQLIITTHSPQVLDMLNDDELDRITICELDEKKGTQFRKLKAKSIATAKRYMKDVGFLSDYWRYGSLEEKI